MHVRLVHLRSARAKYAVIMRIPSDMLPRVVYPHVTDNSAVAQYGKIVLFHPHGRGHHHGTEPGVLPTPPGHSRVDFPHDPYLVARPFQGHTSQAPQARQKPRRKRSKEPETSLAPPHTALRGLCAGGRCTTQSARLATSRGHVNRGRRRTVNTHAHFCPAPDCSYHGWLGRGNIRANGHPGRQPWRQLQCVPVRAISLRRTARSFMANTPRPTSSCVSSHVSPKGWVSRAPRASSRSIPIPW